MTAYRLTLDTDEVLIEVGPDGAIEACVRPRYSLGSDMWVPARVDAAEAAS